MIRRGVARVHPFGRARRAPRWRVATAALTLALVVAACSSDDDGSSSTTTVPTTAGRITVVSQNILHGQACPAATDGCHLPDRVALFAAQLARTCPEVVGLEESNERIVDLLRTAVRPICGGRYRVVGAGDPGLDREVALSTVPVVAHERFRLAGPLRTALWLRTAAAVGAADIWFTHLASSSDDRPCDSHTCPPPCHTTDSLNTCQARQLLALARDHRGPASVLVVGGDLNAKPDESTIAAFRSAGLTDSHLAVGNPECTPATGRSCTSGRDDADMDDLTDPASRQTERIDELFTSLRPGCRLGRPTGLFNARPDTAGRAGLRFPSDHTGVQVTVACVTTGAQRAAARTATVPSSTTTAPAGAAPDAATTAAITAAFESVFAGGATIDDRLGSLEDADALRTMVADGYERSKAIADRISVHIDGITRTGPDRADVTFTLLLDGNAVLDHLPGSALRRNGRWLVTRRAFCDVGTQGTSTIPEACR